ncbi:hypothetical protein HYFRA_00008193 [Hymenoscyphus fraxineus]|uniref:DUF1740-domain-containing protein n=1 Tax=Hymenoscyphus fraxineus TaxID=746836 RepID=A0A9N9L7E7_9HELO|nr:hypothetical protein HYFRA_00008193 [Hymenoscyphus fraxineus]
MSEPNIPKFGSFRPKAQTSQQTPKNPERESKHHSKSGERKERWIQEEEKHRHRHRRHQRSRSRERHGKTTEVREAAPPLKVPYDNSPEIFVIDRKGDEKNLIYNSVHRYSVPPFHRIGAGNVLGAPRNIKIDRDASDDKVIVLQDGRDSNASRRERYAFSKIDREKPRLLRIRPEATVKDQDDPSANYVPLENTRSRKRRKIGAEDDGSSASDDDETHYRSIHGKKKATEPEDGALQYATESDDSSYEDGIPVSNLAVRQKNVELSRRVEEFPHEIESWLALIELQDTLLRDEDDRHRATNAEIRSTAEIKIHMYEKALDRAKTLQDREKLLLGRMAEGAKIWDSNLQTARWEQISKDNIDSLMLWKSSLNFKQTSFTTFRYEEIRDMFLTRIELLSKEALKAAYLGADAIYQQLIYVLLRATLFIRESGYQELGIAIWQGVLEINFQRSEQNSSVPVSPGSLNDFWESEVPRIGEDGALGWRHFLETQDSPEAPPSLTDEPENSFMQVKHQIFGSWAAAERFRSISTPARTMDEVVENDPYRVILFSDIEKFLIVLPSEAESLHKALLDAFLLFCRLSPMSALNREAPYEWCSDAFVEGEVLESKPDSMKKQYFPPKETNEDVTISNVSMLRTSPSSFQFSSDTMFSSKLWFEGIPAWSERYSEQHRPLPYPWVRNTLKQLTQAYFRDYLAEYYLAFEWRNEPDTVKKVAKGLLKKHPASLRLYNAYGMIEHARGNEQISDAVFSAALNMNGPSLNDSNNAKEAILVWRNYTWSKIETSENPFALQQIFSIPNGVVSKNVENSPALLLKTKQYLISNRDHLLSTGELRTAIIYAEILALLEYLTRNSGIETQSKAQGDIASALKVYITFSNSLSERNHSQTISHELLLQSASRILYHHARIGPFRPALLREHLTTFLTLFPRNTIFLSLYTWNESRLRIDNRVRNILQSTVLTPTNDTVPTRLFAIRYELNHGTIHSARSAFEHAIASPTCSSSPALWKLYILFCLHTAEFRPKAREIWHRALRACPWVKELYIVGFEEMGELLGFEEMKGTWRVMGEKELRVHVDLEDLFDEVEERGLEQREGKRLAVR